MKIHPLLMLFVDGKVVFVSSGKVWKVSATLTGLRCWPEAALNTR